MSKVDPAAIEEARRYYAQEVRLAGHLQRPEVVQAFATVPREVFLGPPPWTLASERAGYVELEGDDPRDTYHNVLFAIDIARKLNNGQPSFVGFLIGNLFGSPIAQGESQGKSQGDAPEPIE